MPIPKLPLVYNSFFPAELTGCSAEQKAGKVEIADTLERWNAHKNSYPELTLLARIYLAIPASEVKSERLFSTAGNTITPKRSTLEPDFAERLLFMHQNVDRKELREMIHVTTPYTGCDSRKCEP